MSSISNLQAEIISRYYSYLTRFCSNHLSWPQGLLSLFSRLCAISMSSFLVNNPGFLQEPLWIFQSSYSAQTAKSHWSLLHPSTVLFRQQLPRLPQPRPPPLSFVA